MQALWEINETWWIQACIYLHMYYYYYSFISNLHTVHLLNKIKVLLHLIHNISSNSVGVEVTLWMMKDLAISF